MRHDDRECSRHGELGLDSTTISFVRLTRWIPRSRGSRPVRRALARGSLRIACSLDALVSTIYRRAQNDVIGGKRVLAQAGPHVQGAKDSEGVSAFRIVLQKSFDDADVQRSQRVGTRDGEQGLVQSGRPRRAKRHWESNCGGKAVRWFRSTRSLERVSWSSVSIDERRFGSKKPFLFTKGEEIDLGPCSPREGAGAFPPQGWPRDFGHAKVGSKKNAGDGSVRGRLFEGYHRGGEYPLQGARTGCRSVGRVVKRTAHRSYGRKSIASVAERNVGAFDIV